MADLLDVDTFVARSRSHPVLDVRTPAKFADGHLPGFGLLGHLTEMCAGSNCRATLQTERVSLLTDLAPYLDRNAVPGGTRRNWDSYGDRIGPLTDTQRRIFCDPQTSGGLLIAVAADAASEVAVLLRDAGLECCAFPIGSLLPPQADAPLISIQ